MGALILGGLLYRLYTSLEMLACNLQAFSAVEQDKQTEAAADCSRMLVPPQMISTGDGSSMQYSVHALSPRLRALAAGCFTEAPIHSEILAVCTIQGRSKQPCKVRSLCV